MALARYQFTVVDDLVSLVKQLREAVLPPHTGPASLQ